MIKCFNMALYFVAVQNYHHDLRSHLKIVASFALYFSGSCFYTVLRNLDMDSFTALTFLGPFSDHNCSENIWKGKMELGNCIAPDVFDTDLESSFHFIFFRKLFYIVLWNLNMDSFTTLMTFLGRLGYHIGWESGFR